MGSAVLRRRRGTCLAGDRKGARPLPKWPGLELPGSAIGSGPMRTRPELPRRRRQSLAARWPGYSLSTRTQGPAASAADDRARLSIAASRSPPFFSCSGMLATA